MTLKMIDVDPKKWKSFRKWCGNHETTMKAEVNRFLNKFKEVS